MKNYQYQIVRYLHDRSTSEFVNVGIILYLPENKLIKSRFINKFSRISHFFNEINGHFLISTLKNFEKEIEEVNSHTSELFFKYRNIEEITNSILPKDDSALVCSETCYAIDIDMDSALSDLFDNLVNKYNEDIDNEAHDDKFVWKNIYKKYFDKYEITKKLKAHSVKTSHDLIEFDKAWKNGSWHCYQAISFDLKRIDSIKNKVYKWSGILNELEQADELLNLHFLTASPTKHKFIQEFINETLVHRGSEKLKVSLINEGEAEKFVADIQKEILEHDNN